MEQEHHQESSEETVSQTNTLPNAREILEEAWGVYTDRFALYVSILLVPAILIAVATVLLGVIFALIPDTPALRIPAVFMMALFTVGVFVAYFWQEVSLYCAIRDRGEEITFKEAFQRGWKQIVPFAWVAILFGTFFFFGMFLLLVPGILFLFWFMFAPLIMLDKDTRGLDAMLQSREYVRGLFGPIAWRIIFLGLLLFVLTLVLDMLTPSEAIFDLVMTPVSIIIGPFAGAYFYLLYEKVRDMKGEVPATFTSKQRSKYILVAVAGALVPISVALVSAFVRIYGG